MSYDDLIHWIAMLIVYGVSAFAILICIGILFIGNTSRITREPHE